MTRSDGLMVSVRRLLMLALFTALADACSGAGGTDSADSGGSDSGGVDSGTTAPTDAELKQLAATFPAMPRDVASLATLLGRTPTFASGLPLNDLEYTVFDADYMDGETNGYDTFLPVDPSSPAPGADRVKL